MGTVLDAYDAITGENALLAGQKLSGAQRTLAGAAVVGGTALALLKRARSVCKPARAAESGGRWSRTPESLMDRMTLEAAQRGEGEVIIRNLGDPKFKGMDKMQLVTKSKDGLITTVHYVRDPATGKLMDFKFTRHSTDTPGVWGVTKEPVVGPGTPP